MNETFADCGAEARASLAQALLAPRAIALVGASGDPAKNTARPQRYLRKHGYTGRIIPINPSRNELFGERAWPDLASAPGVIDHAFVMVPADNVEGVVAECGARGIPLVSVFSDGFAETGPEGVRRQRRIVEVARAAGSRLIGPNSIGTIVPPRGLAMSVNAVLDLPRLKVGRLGLVSQSGSMIGAILSRGDARAIGFSALVSVGNEADVSVGEIAGVLADDPETDAILLFMETLRDAPALAVASRKAAAVGKPVVAYVLGRSQIGRQMAVTHTGALAGSSEALAAWLDAQGIVRVDQIETLLEISPLLRQTRPPSSPQRRRLAVLTTTGGGAAMVVDRIGCEQVEVVGPPPAVIAQLAAAGINISASPVTDLTLAGTRRAVYESVLHAFLASDHCDAVLAVAGSSAQFHPQHAVEPIAEAQLHGKSLLAFAAPQADEALRLFADADVPAFRTPESCADALRALARWREPQPFAGPYGEEATAVNVASLRLSRCEPGALDEAEAREVFAALGLPQGEWRICADASAADEAPLPLPAAVKVLSPDIPHKTEIGGVRLNCRSEAQGRDAIAAVITSAHLHQPSARIRGALVQRMESGIAEVIVGYRRDPVAGPTVLIGIGGIHAEIYRDVVVRPAPVSLAEADRMVDAVRGLVVLAGYRGRPAGDRMALVAALRRFSLLACVAAAGDQVIAEAEINPLLVRAAGNGVVALDAVVVLAQKEQR